MHCYAHVGYPKCASTSIQEYLFRRQDIFYLGKHDAQFRTESIRDLFRRAIAGASTLDYDPDASSEMLHQHLDHANAAGIKNVYLSDELLSGVGFAFYLLPKPDCAQILDRIVRLFGGDVTFVIIIRNQLSFLISYYKQLVSEGYPLAFQTFVRNELDPDGYLDRRVGAGPQLLHNLFYDRMFTFIRGNWRTPIMLPFELLVGTDYGFSELLARMGLPSEGADLPRQNVSLTNDQCRAILAENLKKPQKFALRVPIGIFELDRAFKRSIGKSANDAFFDLSLPVHDQSRLNGMFASSNWKTSELIGYELRRFGYPT